jgi:hypothetical protein
MHGLSESSVHSCQPTKHSTRFLDGPRNICRGPRWTARSQTYCKDRHQLDEKKRSLSSGQGECVQNEAILLMHFSARFKASEVLRRLDSELPPELRAKVYPFLQGFSLH